MLGSLQCSGRGRGALCGRCIGGMRHTQNVLPKLTLTHNAHNGIQRATQSTLVGPPGAYPAPGPRATGTGLSMVHGHTAPARAHSTGTDHASHTYYACLLFFPVPLCVCVCAGGAGARLRVAVTARRAGRRNAQAAGREQAGSRSREGGRAAVSRRPAKGGGAGAGWDRGVWGLGAKAVGCLDPLLEEVRPRRPGGCGRGFISWVLANKHTHKTIKNQNKHKKHVALSTSPSPSRPHSRPCPPALVPPAPPAGGSGPRVCPRRPPTGPTARHTLAPLLANLEPI